MKVGFGYDSHRFAGDRKLLLGGVEVPYDRGLVGHSDADVLIHAIADALLGAVGEGDIGGHFPDTDSTFKDISGMKLLQIVSNIVINSGYETVHIDATIVIEKPRIKDYVHRMSANISSVLSIDIGQVNIKVKSNEGMGWIGSGEGAASCAVVTVKKREI